MIITRFAPSPTGTLHIGSVRTVLFNYLYAKRFNGKFRLRIEDTDKTRSNSEYVKNILSTLDILGLKVDDEIIFQSDNINKHQQIAKELLQNGKAYKCYCTVQELEEERKIASIKKETPKYNRKCRDLKEELDLPYTIRLKSPIEGRTEINDLIQHNCGVENEYMDDMILLRSDGSPTYMLAVVVDDHDMNVTHVIRGAEHLNNAYRQKLIYDACGWKTPEFAHVSLIHAENGQKLSKRNDSKSVEEYMKEGFFKEAVLNYLLMLGWTYSDKEEIISMQKCHDIFDIKDVRSSPARFSLTKLLDINSIYLRMKTNDQLCEELKQFIDKSYSQEGWKRIKKGMNGLKERSRTLQELSDMADIYGYDDEFFQKIKANKFLKDIVKDMPWQDEVEPWFKELLEVKKQKLKDIAPLLRLALTKSNVAPSIFEVIQILGKDLFYKRLKNAISK